MGAGSAGYRLIRTLGVCGLVASVAVLAVAVFQPGSAKSAAGRETPIVSTGFEGETAPATPTPTSQLRDLPWGDADCDGELTTRDNQAILRTVLSQPALSQTQPCFAIGSEVLVGNFILYHWADADCDSEMTTRDNQGVLRVVLGQPPLSQTGPCPHVGSLVTVP